jgi:hypothetical protein
MWRNFVLRACVYVALLVTGPTFVCELPAEPPQTPRPSFGFPDLPPIADADPSIRHPVTVSMPTKLKVVRDGDFITLTPTDFEDIKLTIGKNMVTGIAMTKRINIAGETKILGMGMRSGLSWKPDEVTYSRELEHLPKAEFTFEYEIVIFETDMPAQHFWNPQGGKAYKVLWTHTFKERVK